MTNNILRYASFRKETTFGTRPSGDPAFSIDIASAGLDSPADTEIIYNGGLGKSARTHRPGYYAPTGNIVYGFDIDTISHMLKWALNGYSFTEAVEPAVLNTHKIWANRSIDLDSFSVDLGKDAFEHRFMGCKINNFEISVDSELCQATIDLIAQKDAQAAIVSDISSLAIPTAYPLAFHEVTVKKVGLGVAGADIDISADVRSLTLSISNSVSSDSGRGLGSRFPYRLPAFERQVTFSMQTVFDSIEDVQLFWGDTNGPSDSGTTNFPLEFDFDAGTYGSMAITLPNVIYTTVGKQPSGRDELVQSLSGRAFIGDISALLGTTEESEIYCEILNGEGSLA